VLLALHKLNSGRIFFTRFIVSGCDGINLFRFFVSGCDGNRGNLNGFFVSDGQGDGNNGGLLGGAFDGRHFVGYNNLYNAVFK
jgi:hypothetical protein